MASSRFRHRTRFFARAFTFVNFFPANLTSLTIFLLYVVFGCRLFRVPCRFQSNTVRVISSSGRLMMCPKFLVSCVEFRMLFNEIEAWLRRSKSAPPSPAKIQDYRGSQVIYCFSGLYSCSCSVILIFVPVAGRSFYYSWWPCLEL